MKRSLSLLPLVAITGLVALASARSGFGAITVTSQGPMAQINGGGLPGTHIREHSTLWQQNDRNTGTIFYVDSSTGLVVTRATTTDAGLTWTAGVDTGLDTPVGAASTDERNPVVRDFDLDGNLTGFFGTKQGVYGGGNDADNVLFRAASTDNGASWSGEALTTFGGPADLGHTGMNGFIEVFEVPSSPGTLRAYTAMNNITGSPLSATRLVESTDWGATWTDLGNILIDGKDNVIGANGPVFSFNDDGDGGAEKMGWFMFGESAHRGVHLMISTDEGLSWTAHAALSFLDATIRSGDANFLDDSTLRLFYYRNVAGSPSDRQLWYEDFTLSGMSNIMPNNLTVPEPASLTLASMGFLGCVCLAVRRRSGQRKVREASALLDC